MSVGRSARPGRSAPQGAAELPGRARPGNPTPQRAVGSSGRAASSGFEGGCCCCAAFDCDEAHSCQTAACGFWAQALGAEIGGVLLSWPFGD